MNRGRIGALSTSAAIVLLAGCGGSQPPIGVPGTMPQATAIAPDRTVPRRTTTSSYHVLYSFTHTEAHPQAALINVNGTLYGTAGNRTARCEGYDCGTVYSMSTSGAYTLMHRFGGPSHGTEPQAGLLNLKGTLYGTTAYGGRFSCADGCGTVYSISTSGTYKVLYRFSGGSDGANAQGGLIDVSGTLYGTTLFGGGSGCSASGSGAHEGCGTFYSVSTTGSEKVLHRFSDGGNKPWWPNAGLINVNGKLYGTTAQGGSSQAGTVYTITTAGTEKVLHSFVGGNTDGSLPAGLINVSGTLYGTTQFGVGSGCFGFGCGAVFEITTAGQETVLHGFGVGSDGSEPQAGPIDVNGTLYGTTEYGGVRCEHHAGCGVVYALTL